MLRQARTPKVRSWREFAEQEIILPPGGPAERLRFRCHRQPFSRHLLEAYDSRHWQRFVVTAPSQQGKTLLGFLNPICYHLFELRERVVCGVPDMEMSADKWRNDILPVIERTRYRELLPRDGAGSRGGKVQTVRFGNGAELRFMSAGGRDKSRAGYTARVLVVTEVDGFDAAGGSVEADKIKQLEARLRADPARKRVYLECTVSVEGGKIWQEYLGGTQSRIALPCPACGEYVSPEREHLVGWQETADELAAEAAGHFACPSCGQPWTETQRREANRASRLVHRGQEIDRDGQVFGPLPPTKTFSFRWSAVNNLFATAGHVAADCWRAARDANEDNAEKELCQFIFCVPYKPLSLDVLPLHHDTLCGRVADLPRGRVPPDVQWLTVGVDLGKRLGHYVVLAARGNLQLHVVDYDLFEIPSDELGTEKATLAALRDVRDRVWSLGWATAGPNRTPDQVWIDSGYHENQQAVYAFCRESNAKIGRRALRELVYLPVKGFGETVYGRQRYVQPKGVSTRVRQIGEAWHVSWLPPDRTHLAELNVDAWKTWCHRRMVVPSDGPGALTWFAAPPKSHTKWVKHLLSEKQVKTFAENKGEVAVWERAHANNHYLDSLVYGSAAAHRAGYRLVSVEVPAVAVPSTSWFANRKRR